VSSCGSCIFSLDISKKNTKIKTRVQDINSLKMNFNEIVKAIKENGMDCHQSVVYRKDDAILSVEEFILLYMDWSWFQQRN